MLVLGLTGSIGSGKSTVAELLARRGVPVLSSDAIAQQVIEHDAETRAALAEAFGAEIVPPDGPINRRAMAAAIFGPTPEHEQRRLFVERLVHPRVIERIAAELDRLAARGEPIAIVESALIYRAGIEDLFDYVIAVVAPEPIRRERLRLRGMDDADITYRQAIQDSDEELRHRADFVLDNSGTLAELETATETLLALLRTLPPRPVEASA